MALTAEDALRELISRVDAAQSEKEKRLLLMDLTQLLFLKLSAELGREDEIPPEYRWHALMAQPEAERPAFYKRLVSHLRDSGTGMAHRAFSGTVHLEVDARLIELIDAVDWLKAGPEGFGEVYDGLLASAFPDLHPPHFLIYLMAAMVSPDAGLRVQDPLMRTGAMLVAANRVLRANDKNLSVFGMENSPVLFPFAVVNAWLNGIDGYLAYGDAPAADETLLPPPDVILTNLATRPRHLLASSVRPGVSNPTPTYQYAYLQHIYETLRPGGRAAVIVPDTLLSADGLGRSIRADLLDRCDLHTILRLPTGTISGAPGLKASVLFFDRHKQGKGTEGVWVYDMRKDAPSYIRRRPPSDMDFSDFFHAVTAKADGSPARVEADEFHYFSREEIRDRGDDLDLTKEVSMLTKIRFERFKNFREGELHLGPLTLLVGTNAAGKSNIRDGLRFLHGISRGYTLAEIIGEKWVEGGVLQWQGLRGGTREVAFQGAETFALEVTFQLTDRDVLRNATYRIEVNPGSNGAAPRVVAERLAVEGRGQYVFDSHPGGVAPTAGNRLYLPVTLRKEGRKGFVGPTISFLNTQPVLSQIENHPDVQLPTVKEFARLALHALSSMRFLDLEPEKMRKPSFPGQVVLGDRGENLSSVLQAICADESRKAALLGWLRELTPLDVRDLVFKTDLTGQILAYLVEENGYESSAYSASDGTLRFLAMIAALLGPEPARFYFFEELENGIHPTRLHLLLQLIEQKVKQGGTQVIATTHSPQLLGFLSEEARESANLIYRLPGHSDARSQRILDIPDVRRVLEEQNMARLHASGWLEDAVFFLADEEEGE